MWKRIIPTSLWVSGIMFFVFVCTGLLMGSAGATSEQDQGAQAAKQHKPVAVYKIKRQAITSGGNRAGSTTYALMHSIGQPTVGSGSSSGYRVDMGLWQPNTGPFVCGDPSNDGSVDISDAVYLIQYIFAGGPAPNPLASGDANGDGSVDISDAVYLIQYIFSGGPAPQCK